MNSSSAQAAEPPPPSDAPQEPASGGTISPHLIAGLIGSTFVLLLSVLLPWVTWNTSELLIVRAGQQPYSVNNNGDNEMVILAGLAALALAVAARAVDRRFAAYTAIPGGLCFLAVLQRGIAIHVDVIESFDWGYWVAAGAATAVLGLSLAALPRRSFRS
jgi:hypothetical protein